jgi:hypothetical protein
LGHLSEKIGQQKAIPGFLPGIAFFHVQGFSRLVVELLRSLQYNSIDPICSKSKFERGWMVLNCPFCGKEMIQGKVCSSEALWWQNREDKHRLNDEGGFLGRFNGDRITAYHCERCKKIIIDEE